VIRTNGYPELVKRLQARVTALNEKEIKAPSKGGSSTR
jgi:hypothetical protein